jgi:hypothetical protein
MRPPGWEAMLYDHIRNARSRPFAWGQHDCVLWSADWVLKMTGIDPASQWRGTYGTEEGARQVLAALELETVAELADRHLTAITPSQAHRGDIMLHPNGMLGICDGPHAYFLTTEGTTRIAFLSCPRAWRV